MKHIRTVITMIVVLSMLVSSVGVFAADETAKSTTFSDVAAGTPVASAVAKLVGYGVINGYEDGTFKPDNTITRAEFAAIITRFKGVVGPDNAVTGFADLDGDESRAWARPYVKAAVDAGIINGFEDGTFRAAEPVTYEQAIKMIVCAIGYEPVAKSEYSKQQALNNPTLTWSTGYIMAASKNGITKNAATANVTEPAARGVVAILTSNAYEVPKLNQNTDINGNISYEKDEGTYGEGQYNTQEEIKGVVTATAYTSLDGKNLGVNVNEIVIETNDGTVTYEMTETLTNSVDLEDIIGKRVIAYYAKDERALTSIAEDRNSVIRIDESQINRPLKNEEISYVEDGRNRSVGVSGYTFIYNGKADYIKTVAELDSKFSNGYIEINEVTGVVKVTSFDVMVANSYNKNEGNGTIYLKYNDTYNGNPYYEFPSGGTSSKPEIFVNGTKKEFESFSISAYGVINYMESPAGTAGREIRRMYVTTGSKTGKLTAVLEGERLVELNNSEFTLTNDYNNYDNTGKDKKAPFEINDSYTYYLDHTGQIAAINYNPAAQGSSEIGYVVGANANDGKIKIIRKNGTAQIFTLKKKVKFDGVSIDNSEIVTALQTVADEMLKDSEEYKKLKALEDDGIPSNEMGKSYSQPVKFSISGGEINAIDSVKTTTDEGEGSFGINALYTGTDVKPSTTSVKVNDTTYQLSSSTVVMYVPDDRTKDSDFAVMTPSKAFSVSKERQIEVFGADESAKVKTASLVLIYGMNPSLVFTGSSPYMIVTRKINGEQAKLEGFKSGAKEVSEVVISEEPFYTDANSAWVSFDSVEKGDLIRLLEKDGEVVAIEMIYDASAAEENLNKNCPGVGNSGLSFQDTDGSSDIYIYYAEVFEKQPENQENKIFVTTVFGDSNVEEIYNKKVDAMETVTVSASTVYYSFDGNDIIAGESMDVMVDELGAESKVIFVRTGSKTANIKLFYVVK